MAKYDIYSQYQDVIETVLKAVCRRHGLRYDRADDFCQSTRVKLIQDDCAILRAFKGLSTFKTFLTTVIEHKYRDWLDETHGKFRNSVEARRLGPIAIQLERLVLRDGIPYDEAVQLLISRGVASSIAQCDEIWARLKRAARRQLVSDEDLENRLAVPSTDPVEDAERLELTRKVHAALRAVIDALPPSDNLIFRWRYWDRFTVARIAQLQQVEQKPLYRRFEQLHQRLRRDLLARGITIEEIRRLFDELGIDPDDFKDEDGK